MDKATIESMDINILVSLINMKLRDYYLNLEEFCYDNNIEMEVVLKRIETAGYEYNKGNNQIK